MGSLVAQGKHSKADEQWRALREDPHTTPGNLRTALRAESEYGEVLMLPAAPKLAKAEAVLQDALARQRDTLEEDDPSTLQSMQNLGMLLQRRDRPSEAEPFFREAADGRRRVFGRDDPNTLGSVIGLARSLWRQEKYVDAEECFNEIIEGRQRGLGAEHRDTRAAMNELAGLYDAWGKPEKAAEWRAKLPTEQEAVASDQNEE